MNSILVPVLSVLSLMALSVPVVLAGPATAIATNGPQGPVLPSLIRLLGAFILVIVLVYTCSIFFKKMSRRNTAGGSRVMSVLDVLPLGAKARLVTVKIGHNVYVIGAGESQVNTIASMDEQEYRLLSEQDRVDVVPFRERLKKLARK
jgi:flagellar biosynthetic protein FliO